MKTIKRKLWALCLLSMLAAPALMAEDPGFEGAGRVEAVDPARSTVTVDGETYRIPVDLKVMVVERDREAPAFAVIKPGATIGWLGEGSGQRARLVSVIVHELSSEPF